MTMQNKALEALVAWFDDEAKHGESHDIQISQLREYVEPLRQTLSMASETKTKTETRSLSTIAHEIRDHWRPVNYAAKPYLEAMRTLDTMNDMYGCDTASSIVAYFLANAQTWKGEVARRVKAELNTMLKNHRGR